MSVSDGKRETENEDYEQFPIPRTCKINNPKEAIKPEYKPKNDVFNPDLFQLFFSLVNFHLSPYELNPSQEFSPALETFCTAFDEDTDNSDHKDSKNIDPDMPESLVMRQHIVKKYLIECQEHFHELTAEPNLTKLAVLHNELFYASEVLRNHKPDPKMMNFVDMLMADTLDLYNSAIGKIISEQYFGAGKSVEELINDLLKKELLFIRELNRESFHSLSQCIIHRTLEKAPANQVSKIKSWATENKISVEGA